MTTGGSFAVDLACGEFDGDSIPGYLARREIVVVHGGSRDAEVKYGLDADT
ncbi:MAG: hypothetical protein ACI89X_005145 [Planctomycetota bacterium]|jgi:hypothetical protein